MNGCDGYSEWLTSRRSVLKGAALASVGWMFPSAIAQVAGRAKPSGRDLLVVVFLRGGADGLNLVPPYGDDGYHRNRPTMRILKPGEGARAEQALDLDGFFGLHPALAPILPLYKEGKLAVLHAVGSDETSRSHFEAMAAMERGQERMGSGVASGWLARYLNSSQGDSPLRAVSFSYTLPDSLKGGANASNLPSIDHYSLSGGHGFQASIAEMYAGGKDEIVEAGRQTLDLLEALGKLDYRSYEPEGGADYPVTDLGSGLRQAAFLAKAEVGIEVVCLDTYGWDTHVLQGAATGNHANLTTHLATCLAAFAKDMAKSLDGVTVIAMTEFGRRVYENGSLGTDHGRGSCLFAFGGAVNGGKVHGRWPGLRSQDLDGSDLKVTTDYRQVLAEALRKRMRFGTMQDVFPGMTEREVGLFRA